LSEKSLVFFKHIIYEPQEFPLKQLWYHDAVLFLSPAALSESVYQTIIINRCHPLTEEEYSEKYS
jgi:hypothetical protein